MLLRSRLCRNTHTSRTMRFCFILSCAHQERGFQMLHEVKPPGVPAMLQPPSLPRRPF